MKLNIAFFIGSLTGGGAERVVVSLSNYLVKNGHKACIITMHDSSEDFYVPDPRVSRVCLAKAGENHGIKKLLSNVNRVIALRKTIKTVQPDILVGMMTTSALFAILACIGLPTRVIGSERNYPGKKNIPAIWSFLRKYLYCLADAHVAQTQDVADWMSQNTSAKNISIIPNAIAWPIGSYPPKVQPISVIPENKKFILAVGSKLEQKGFDLLLESFGHVSHEHPDWYLVIAGLSSNEDNKKGSGDKLVAQARELGVDDNLKIIGRVGNISDWYQQCDLFVLSSRYEGFPNVLLEAMACGVACVSFNCKTGPADMIEDGINGFLINDGDVEALANKLKQLMVNDNLREIVKAKAVCVREHYAESEINHKWITLFRNTLQETL